MLTCQIITPDRADIYEGVERATLPAIRGEMQVLTGHAKAFIGLRSGDIVLYKGEEESLRVHIESGECHIDNDRLVVIM